MTRPGSRSIAAARAPAPLPSRTVQQIPGTLQALRDGRDLGRSGLVAVADALQIADPFVDDGAQIAQTRRERPGIRGGDGRTHRDVATGEARRVAPAARREPSCERLVHATVPAPWS